MRRMWYGNLVVLGLVALAPLARAGDKAADEPTVVIRVKSLDMVIQNFKLLAPLLGRDKAVQDIQALIQAKSGAAGLQGIDLKRPVGAYVRFGAALDNLNGAVLVPVTDEKAFLTLLKNNGLNPNKGKDDIYTLESKQGIDFYLRFKNQYACLSGIDPENLSDKNLLDPAKVLTGPQDSMLTAMIRLDQVPDAAKLLASAQLEQNLQNEQQKDLAGETPAQKEFRKALLLQVAKTANDVLKDGRSLQLDVALDQDKQDLAVRVALAAQPNTELAKAIAGAGKTKSLFAGLMTKDAAFRVVVDATLPPAMQQAFAKAVETSTEKALSEITDAGKRKQAQTVFDALMPTVKAGQVDAFFGMAGPIDKHYTVLGAVKLANGDELGSVLHKLLADELKNLPVEQQKKFQLDVDSVGTVKIHKFELPRDAKTGKVLDDLPGDPNLYVAFRKDAVLMAIGPKALPALKEAIANDQPAAAPIFLFDLNAARLTETLVPGAKDFPAGRDGKIRVAVEGGPALTLRLSVGLDVLQFFAKMRGKE